MAQESEPKQFRGDEVRQRALARHQRDQARRFEVIERLETIGKWTLVQRDGGATELDQTITRVKADIRAHGQSGDPQALASLGLLVVRQPAFRTEFDDLLAQEEQDKTEALQDQGGPVPRPDPATADQASNIPVAQQPAPQAAVDPGVGYGGFNGTAQNIAGMLPGFGESAGLTGSSSSSPLSAITDLIPGLGTPSMSSMPSMPSMPGMLPGFGDSAGITGAQEPGLFDRVKSMFGFGSSTAAVPQQAPLPNQPYTLPQQRPIVIDQEREQPRSMWSTILDGVGTMGSLLGGFLPKKLFGGALTGDAQGLHLGRNFALPGFAKKIPLLDKLVSPNAGLDLGPDGMRMHGGLQAGAKDGTGVFGDIGLDSMVDRGGDWHKLGAHLGGGYKNPGDGFSGNARLEGYTDGTRRKVGDLDWKNGSLHAGVHGMRERDPSGRLESNLAIGGGYGWMNGYYTHTAERDGTTRNTWGLPFFINSFTVPRGMQLIRDIRQGDVPLSTMFSHVISPPTAQIISGGDQVTQLPAVTGGGGFGGGGATGQYPQAGGYTYPQAGMQAGGSDWQIIPGQTTRTDGQYPQAGQYTQVGQYPGTPTQIVQSSPYVVETTEHHDQNPTKGLFAKFLDLTASVAGFVPQGMLDKLGKMTGGTVQVDGEGMHLARSFGESGLIKKLDKGGFLNKLGILPEVTVDVERDGMRLGGGLDKNFGPAHVGAGLEMRMDRDTSLQLNKYAKGGGHLGNFGVEGRYGSELIGGDASYTQLDGKYNGGSVKAGVHRMSGDDGYGHTETNTGAYASTHLGPIPVSADIRRQAEYEGGSQVTGGIGPFGVVNTTTVPRMTQLYRDHKNGVGLWESLKHLVMGPPDSEIVIQPGTQTVIPGTPGGPIYQQQPQLAAPAIQAGSQLDPRLLENPQLLQDPSVLAQLGPDQLQHLQQLRYAQSQAAQPQVAAAEAEPTTAPAATSNDSSATTVAAATAPAPTPEEELDPEALHDVVANVREVKNQVSAWEPLLAEINHVNAAEVDGDLQPRGHDAVRAARVQIARLKRQLRSVNLHTGRWNKASAKQRAHQAAMLTSKIDRTARAAVEQALEGNATLAAAVRHDLQA